VAVKIADALDIEQGGQITSTTESSGNSGAITVSGRDIALAGGMITAESDPAKEGGAAGDVVVNAADSLSIDDIGEISTSTFGTGKGGDVHVTARDITLSSEGGIFASSDSLTQGGAAGDIVVNATASLRLFTGAEISSSTFGLGNGGNVEVMAPDILLSGAAPGGRFSSGIFAVSASITRGGAAGNLMVTAAGTLDIEDGAVINSATDGLGKGGTVEVTARDILLSGGSDIGVDSFSATQGGAAGDVFVNAGALNVQGGSSISSSTYGLANGGKVEIAAGDITISSAGQIVAESNSTTQGGAAGDVLLTAAGALDIGSGGTISSSTAGLGRGGTVEVTAAEATVDGSIVAVSQSPGKGGPAGNLAVSVAGDLDIESDGDISSSTDGLGNSGSVEVTAGEATVAGIIFATSESSGQGGAAGSVVIDIAGALNIERGGFIDSATVGLGNGGNLNVAAGEITDAGLLLADSESTGQGGPAGVVVVNTPGTLDVEPGGAIDSATSGLGNGGNLDIAAGNVIDSGFVLADSISTGPGGKGGNISVRSAGSLDIQAGGELDSSTFGLGAGGTVTAMARDITVAGRIFANSDSPAQGGNAGDVVVNAAGTLDVEGGGLISSSTLGQGNGGSVKISAQNLAISGKSAIFANSDSSTRGGAGGDISIDVGEALSMNNRAEVGTSAVSGNAGDIAIHVGTDATVEGRSGITSSAGMNGGSIALNAGTLIFLLDSSITATAGSLRETAGNLRNSAGAGGDITLDPEFMILDDSLISANAAVGQGGNILLEANYFFNSGSEITATGATSGTVTITSPQLDLSGALIGLPSAPIDAGSQIQETCAMAVNGDFSSFLALGKGDIEAQPDESQPGSGDSDQVHRVPQARGHPAHRGNGAP
jgi:large exoprotein involved in heme utilization and adhesion